MTISKKIKLDAGAAMRAHQKSSSASAMDRFAIAAKITEVQPHGLAAPEPVSIPVAAGQGGSALKMTPVSSFDISICQVGSIVQVPLAMIDANPLSPRHIYRSEEIDVIASTMPKGQDVAAHGYVKNGRIQLIDGGTRLRAARITDRGFLDVKIEEAPSDELALFDRARALNEQRSPTTPLDFAISLKTLLDRGAVANQRDIVAKVKGPDGARLSEAHVSMYLRIARIPDKLHREMSEAEETVSFAALYAVSEIFTEDATEEAASQQMQIALDVIDEIRRKKLNRAQITALVKSKLEGPKTRERSAAVPLEFGSSKGQIKTFAKKGQIDLSLKGLKEEDLPEVRQVLVKALEDHMARKKRESEQA